MAPRRSAVGPGKLPPWWDSLSGTGGQYGWGGTVITGSVCICSYFYLPRALSVIRIGLPNVQPMGVRPALEARNLRPHWMADRDCRGGVLQWGSRSVQVRFLPIPGETSVDALNRIIVRSKDCFISPPHSTSLTRRSTSLSGGAPRSPAGFGNGRVSDEGRGMGSGGGGGGTYLGETPLRVLSLEPWGHKLSQTGGVNTVRGCGHTK